MGVRLLGRAMLGQLVVVAINYDFVINVYRCVFCCISLFCVYMCVRMPSSPMSIAGVPSGQALLGFPITAHHQ